MTATRGLFFTSIPKGGKNLLYSFLNELDYRRPPIARELALRHVEAPWLAASGRTCTYALPTEPVAQKPELAGAFKTFLAAATALQPGEALHHHFPYGQELADGLRAAGVPVVFVTRDPRDLLLSMADYILVQGKPVHLAEKFRMLDRGALIERLWAGDAELISFADYYAAFAPWRQAPGVITLTFESLVGEAGGGDCARQDQALRTLTAALGRVDEAVFARACTLTFNRSAGTFFKGRQGRWREETAPGIRSLLDSPPMRALAAEWGYAS